MLVPDLLSTIRRNMPSDPRVDLGDDWTRVGGHWTLKIVVRLSVTPTEFMPMQSAWRIVLDDDPEHSAVRIYPDAIDGITATFPHQDTNGAALPGTSWRLGKPCLERPHAVLNRSGNHDEPDELSDRIGWNVWRLLGWVDAAAEGKLLRPGDHFELPMHLNWDAASAVAFREDARSTAEWAAISPRWGFARIAVMPAAKETLVLTEFLDERGVSLRKPMAQAGDPKTASTALWVMLPEAPVLPPWRLPSTWGELIDWSQAHGLNLAELTTMASQQRLFRRHGRASRMLLLGFPIPERIGEEPERVHWLAITGLRFTRTGGRRSSSGSGGRYQAKHMIAVHRGDALVWRRTENWADDQLRRRGQAEEGLRVRKVLLLGCGALGAAIADNLMRAGVVKLGLVDFDTVRVGNLGRHTLTMASIGHHKASALAIQLNNTVPDAEAVAFVTAFPPTVPALRAAMAVYDVVVDCTAEDRVIDAMAEFDWEGEKRFYSFSMTWAAEGLLAFSASETAFPAVDARSRFAAAVGDTTGRMESAAMEGIGCWHPVFPASADDVALWGAIATKFMRRNIAGYDRSFVHFVQNDDGGVTVLDA